MTGARHSLKGVDTPAAAGGWTEDRIARLKELRAKGESYGDIGKKIGMSRNACISKASRIGIAKQDKPSRPIKTPALKAHSQEVVAQAERAGRDERDLKILTMLAKGHTFERVRNVFGVSEEYLEALWNARETQDPVGEARA